MSENGAQMRLVACVTADVPSAFADNVQARCALCGTAIYHRPHALRDVPGAQPACLPCALDQAEQAQALGAAVTYTVTERAMREVAVALGLRRQGDEGRKR